MKKFLVGNYNKLEEDPLKGPELLKLEMQDNALKSMIMELWGRAKIKLEEIPGRTALFRDENGRPLIGKSLHIESERYHNYHVPVKGYRSALAYMAEGKKVQFLMPEDNKPHFMHLEINKTSGERFFVIDDAPVPAPEKPKKAGKNAAYKDALKKYNEFCSAGLLYMKGGKRHPNNTPADQAEMTRRDAEMEKEVIALTKAARIEEEAREKEEMRIAAEKRKKAAMEKAAAKIREGWVELENPSKTKEAAAPASEKAPVHDQDSAAPIMGDWVVIEKNEVPVSRISVGEAPVASTPGGFYSKPRVSETPAAPASEEADLPTLEELNSASRVSETPAAPAFAQTPAAPVYETPAMNDWEIIEKKDIPAPVKQASDSFMKDCVVINSKDKDVTKEIRDFYNIVNTAVAENPALESAGEKAKSAMKFISENKNKTNFDISEYRFNNSTNYLTCLAKVTAFNMLKECYVSGNKAAETANAKFDNLVKAVCQREEFLKAAGYDDKKAVHYSCRMVDSFIKTNGKSFDKAIKSIEKACGLKPYVKEKASSAKKLSAKAAVNSFSKIA